MSTSAPRRLIDFHAHVDHAWMPWFHDFAEANDLEVVNLWDLSTPPRPDTRWFGSKTPGMRFFHVPDLNGIGSATFEERESSRLRQSVEGGACGIKVWKNLGLWQRDVDGELLRVSDGRLGWLWRRAADLGLPVAIHVGDAEAFFEPLDERNERIEELERHPDYWFGDRSKYPPLESIHEDLVQVIADNPETRFVAVHFGCFIQFERLHALLMRFPNLSVDTAARIADLGRERDRDAVLRIFHDHGDRVVFGTDIIRCTRECMPDVTPEDPYLRGYFQLHFDFFQSDEPVPSPLPFQGSWPVRGLGLDGGVTERLFYENAARLLRLG